MLRYILIGLGGLLLVIGLSLLLWPIVGHHEPRDSTVCLSQVKRNGVALFIYLADHDGAFPHRDHWMDALFPYSKDEAALRCPLVGDDPQHHGYAFNSNLSLLELDKVVDPVATPLIYDSINLARNASDPVTSLPDPTRHQRGNVMGYADGHARVSPPGAPVTPAP
jgi:hypothetical protein